MLFSDFWIFCKQLLLIKNILKKDGSPTPVEKSVSEHPSTLRGLLIMMGARAERDFGGGNPPKEPRLFSTGVREPSFNLHRMIFIVGVIRGILNNQLGDIFAAPFFNPLQTGR